MKKDERTETAFASVEPVATLKKKDIRSSVIKSNITSAGDAKQVYIINNKLTPAKCASYLKAQFPEPTDFKKVLKFLKKHLVFFGG